MIARLGGVPIRSADGAVAAISAHGAHLLSWLPRRGGERLYLSGRASAASGQAIRGGVPVIFPQFAGEGPLPKHGFARGMPWQLTSCGQRADGAGYARYALTDDTGTRLIWPYAFHATLAVLVDGDRLELELAIRNSGDRAFQFTAALHSYLAVDDIATARLSGLRGRRYRDSADGNAIGIETREQIDIAGEVDRIYFDADGAIELITPVSRLRVQQQRFTDVVVWNPGAAKGGALQDLDADGWRQMLCVEAAAIGSPISLAPAAEWRGTQILETL